MHFLNTKHIQVIQYVFTVLLVITNMFRSIVIIWNIVHLPYCGFCPPACAGAPEFSACAPHPLRTRPDLLCSGHTSEKENPNICQFSVSIEIFPVCLSMLFKFRMRSFYINYGKTYIRNCYCYFSCCVEFNGPTSGLLTKPGMWWYCCNPIFGFGGTPQRDVRFKHFAYLR